MSEAIQGLPRGAPETIRFYTRNKWLESMSAAPLAGEDFIVLEITTIGTRARLVALEAAQPRVWDAETIGDAPDGWYRRNSGDGIWTENVHEKKGCVMDANIRPLWKFFGPQPQPQEPT